MDAGVVLGDVWQPASEEDQLNLECSRLGGEPTWFRPLSQMSPLRRRGTLNCGYCTQRTTFIGQFSAGSATAPRRLLHVFGCQNPGCGFGRQAWLVLRSTAGSSADALRGARSPVAADSWPCFTLWMYTEPEERHKSDAHELELLERYRASEFAVDEPWLAELSARDWRDEDVAADSESGSDDGEADETQQSAVFQRFTRRLDRSPSQVVRLSRVCKPLWLAKPPPQVTEGAWPPDCELCGAPRRPELQLLPTLLHLTCKLCPERACDGDVGWSTVVVYTCSRDCISEEPCREFVVVQPSV
uniref:Programmed cell death protein 2 C-terminal domain-containing protein n=1 Tax=Noctiluca scintillans TaxID=2966 RepID=A0A7S1A2B4_NOCSC